MQGVGKPQVNGPGRIGRTFRHRVAGGVRGRHRPCVASRCDRLLGVASGGSVAWSIGPTRPDPRSGGGSGTIEPRARNRASHEAHLPAEAPAPGPQARLPQPHAHPWRPCGRREPSVQGPRPPVGLSRHLGSAVCPERPNGLEHLARSGTRATSRRSPRVETVLVPGRCGSSAPRSMPTTRSPRGDTTSRSASPSVGRSARRSSATASADGCGS